MKYTLALVALLGLASTLRVKQDGQAEENKLDDLVKKAIENCDRETGRGSLATYGKDGRLNWREVRHCISRKLKD